MKLRAFSTAALLCLALLTGGKIVAAPPAPAEVARAAAELLRRDYRVDAPGAAVLVARGDTILFRAARGAANIETHAPLRPDSLFRIGSLTKQFTAAGLLLLVEAGRVRLEDPLSHYLPDYPGGDRITLLQLLNHSSGVANFNGMPGYLDGASRRDMRTAQLIGLFRDAPPDFAPGSSWAYSNSNYVLIGAVIEAVTGETWHAYLERVLFRPLGMRHTGYGHDPRVAARLVQGYTHDGDRIVPMRAMSMTQPHAAGALVSNVDDLLRWNRAFHEGRVLRSAAYRRMITPVGPAADPAINYGFGLYRARVRTNDALRHGGHIFGFTSSLTYLPGPDITVVVLENDDAPTGPDDADTLVRRLAAAALGDPYPELRAVPADAAALRAAEGVYRFYGGVTRILRLVGDVLTAQRDRAPRVPLTPIGADDFLYADGFNRVRLVRDRSGAIGGLRFFANGDGEGAIGTRTDEPMPGAAIGLRLPRAALERLTGTYANGGLTLTVFIEGDALKARIAGQEPVGLRATSLGSVLNKVACAVCC
jgi:D-alanyl-D-alanine carboxypeptidase